jgi:hypothetical protein
MLKLCVDIRDKLDEISVCVNAIKNKTPDSTKVRFIVAAAYTR